MEEQPGQKIPWWCLLIVGSVILTLLTMSARELEQNCVASSKGLCSMYGDPAQREDTIGTWLTRWKQSWPSWMQDRSSPPVEREHSYPTVTSPQPAVTGSPESTERSSVPPSSPALPVRRTPWWMVFCDGPEADDWPALMPCPS